VGDAIHDQEMQAEKDREGRRQDQLQASIESLPQKETKSQNEHEAQSEEVPSQEKSGEQSSPDVPEEITFDDIQDKLNIVRSGKSLDDSKIKDEMKQYLDGMESSERFALFGFLESIGHIVAHEADGKRVKDPDDEPYSVKMQRVTSLEKDRKEKDKLHQARQTNQVSKDAGMRKKEKENRAPPISAGKRVGESAQFRMKQMLIS